MFRKHNREKFPGVFLNAARADPSTLRKGSIGMTREEYIKRLIYENGMTIKSFAQSIDMPYSTLLSMLGVPWGAPPWTT